MTLDADRVRAFYSFMVEREQIRLRRLAGLPRDQWTSDPIFQTYSFTNVKREHDRTTVAFRRLYEQQIDACPITDAQNCYDLLMTCAVYRYFGTIRSAEVLGPYTWARPDGRYDEEYFQHVQIYGLQGDLTFTGAYLIPACGESRDKCDIVADILRSICLVKEHVQNALDHLDGPRSWQRACEILCTCRGVGSFMAKEILLDYLMMVGTDRLTDWETWTPVGPGARRGAARVRDGYLDRGLPEREALEVIREIYAAREEHWPAEIMGKPSVELDLTTIQFCECEWDKYSRVAEGRRPKRRFNPTIDEVTCETR